MPKTFTFTQSVSYWCACKLPGGKDLNVHPKMYRVAATLRHLAMKTEIYTYRASIGFLPKGTIYPFYLGPVVVKTKKGARRVLFWPIGMLNRSLSDLIIRLI